MQMSNKGNITYIEIVYLTELLKIIPLNKIDEDLREGLYNLKKDLEKPAETFVDKKTFKLIILGGDSVKDSQGNVYYTEPQFKSRKDFNGSDEEFETETIKINNKRQKIKEELVALATETSDFYLKPFLSKEQFDRLAKTVNSLDILAVEHLLVLP